MPRLTRLFKQAITYMVLASMQLGTLVQSTQAYAQYVPPTYNSPQSGYTPDGVLYMAGQRIGNPHQILHDAQIPAFMTITATQYTFTNNPSHGQGTLAQMETATTTGSDSSVLLNRLYLSPTNPYVQGAPGPANYQTYQGVLANAQQANYLLTNADDGKTYAFKTLTAASRQAVDLLIRELPNTPQFRAAADPLGGGTGVRVTQNGDAAALAAYLLTVKPYDYSWQPNFGNFSGQNNAAYSGWANSNNFAPDYSEGGGAPTSQAALIKQLQDTAVANDKRVRSQTSANSLDLNGVSPNSLFGEGYNLFAYGSNSNPNRDLENDFLRRLQSGQLEAGSADYLEASRIAQERYRIAYATRLETNKPLQYSVADSQRKANELQLGSINPNELFGQGFDLFQYNKALRANGEAENALLARLQAGELTPGTADYLQATQIAQERLRLAYSQSLVPPEPKKVSKWKLIAGVVAGAILTFVTAGAAAPYVLSAVLGTSVASASAIIAGGFIAGTALGATVAAVAGVIGSVVGTVISTTITTGSFSQGLKAGGQALVSGSVTAIVSNIVASAFGLAGLTGLDGMAGTISNVAMNTISGAVSQTILGGGSFADNLKKAAVSSIVTAVSASAANVIGANNDALGGVGTDLAHAALGCVAGAARSGSANGCAAGAAGAVVGHLGAGWIDAATGKTLDDKTLSFWSSTLGGAAAAAVGTGDKVNANFSTGSTTAANAVDNNYLTTRDLNNALIKLKNCNIGCEQIKNALLRDFYQGGEQQPVARVEELCKANPGACASRVQDISNALTELQKPETRALLGDKGVDALIQRQISDLNKAVGALNWGVDHIESNRAIVLTALAIGATAVGAGAVLSVGRALVAACTSGALSPSCVAASEQIAIAAGEIAGGVPTSGVVTPVLASGAAAKLAAAAAAKGEAQVAREIALIQDEATVLSAANKPFNDSGLSQGARAWDKHDTSRLGGTFPPLTGNSAQKNETVANWVTSVVQNPNTNIAKLSSGAIEYRAPSGQGFIIEPNGQFNILDPRW